MKDKIDEVIKSSIYNFKAKETQKMTQSLIYYIQFFI